jgi:glucose/arabinose dehydrogenase
MRYNSLEIGDGRFAMKVRIWHALALVLGGAGIFSTALFFNPVRADGLSEKLQTILLPPGFEISLFASGVTGARSLALGDEGTIFVGTRSEGRVYALKDSDGDFRADTTYIIAEGLNSPNGVAFRNGALYVAEIGRVLRYDAIEKHLLDPPRSVILSEAFPTDGHHGWKFIRFGPDGKLYIPVGVPCNVCEETDERYGTIMRMNPDGSDLEIYARGVRNSVGFDWQPDTNILYFTDNGRDWLGNENPPDELNAAQKKGMHFGFPYCHGGTIADPDFGKGKRCDDYTPPAINLGAHAAALGMRFYTGEQFPAEYKKQVFIAEHGSWNRIPLFGYRITLVRFENATAVSYETFAEGWLDGVSSWGRPVDLLQLNDGSLLISDDKADAIYRIRYIGTH